MLYERDMVLFPPGKLGIMTGMLFILVSGSCIKGGSDLKSIIGIPYCGGLYWIAKVVITIVGASFTYMI